MKQSDKPLVRSRFTLCLSIILLSCVSGRSFDPDYNTLHIINNSGGVVRIMADDGFSYSLGRAWPGSTCLLPRLVSTRGIRFGIQHLGQPEHWMQYSLFNGHGVGWVLEINQSSQVVYDLLDVKVGERCQ